MKIAIISDLHGDYAALQSLRENYDELWVLGDLVNYGPEPGAVVDFVKANSSVVVRGNHDHSLGYDVDPRCAFSKACSCATKAGVRSQPCSTANYRAQVERLVGDHVSPAEQESTIRRDLEGLEGVRTEPTVAS
ncbi:MAG: metallophosphoesterase family protein [Terracidiphilus sp.]